MKEPVVFHDLERQLYFFNPGIGFVSYAQNPVLRVDGATLGNPPWSYNETGELPVYYRQVPATRKLLHYQKKKPEFVPPATYATLKDTVDSIDYEDNNVLYYEPIYEDIPASEEKLSIEWTQPIEGKPIDFNPEFHWGSFGSAEWLVKVGFKHLDAVCTYKDNGAYSVRLRAGIEKRLGKRLDSYFDYDKKEFSVFFKKGSRVVQINIPKTRIVGKNIWDLRDKWELALQEDLAKFEEEMPCSYCGGSGVEPVKEKK